MNLYGKSWQRKRAHIMRRDGYMSQLAKRYGRHVAGDTVHHILPVEFFPEYRMSDWNLITITAAEHNRMHDRETHRLSDEGLDLARRTAAQRGLNLPDIMARLEESAKEDDPMTDGYQDEEEEQ